MNPKNNLAQNYAQDHFWPIALFSPSHHYEAETEGLLAKVDPGFPTGLGWLEGGEHYRVVKSNGFRGQTDLILRPGSFTY